MELPLVSLALRPSYNYYESAHMQVWPLLWSHFEGIGAIHGCLNGLVEWGATLEGLQCLLREPTGSALEDCWLDLVCTWAQGEVNGIWFYGDNQKWHLTVLGQQGKGWGKPLLNLCAPKWYPQVPLYSEKVPKDPCPADICPKISQLISFMTDMFFKLLSLCWEWGERVSF